MRALILAATAAIALSACGGNNAAENAEANAAMDANMTMDANMDANMMGNMDSNMMGGADMNTATNGATEANMMAQDMNTNAPDTNLANGM